MNRLLVVVIAVALLAGLSVGCAGPKNIDQRGTSGGKSADKQPGGDVINISVIVEKKDEIKDAFDIVGQVTKLIPGASQKLPGLPEPKPEPKPDLPAEELANPEPIEDVTPRQGQVKEVE